MGESQPRPLALLRYDIHFLEKYVLRAMRLRYEDTEEFFRVTAQARVRVRQARLDAEALPDPGQRQGLIQDVKRISAALSLLEKHGPDAAAHTPSIE